MKSTTQNVLIAIVAIGLAGAPVTLTAQGNSQGHGHGHGKGDDGDDHGKGKGKEKDKDRAYENQGGPVTQYYYRDQDYGRLAQYYDGPRDLPPGLRKKYYRTGSLPTGWERRFRPMPVVVVQQLPPIPAYYQRGYLDGYAVVVDPRTRIIIDAVDIFNAATRR